MDIGTFPRAYPSWTFVMDISHPNFHPCLLNVTAQAIHTVILKSKISDTLSFIWTTDTREQFKSSVKCCLFECAYGTTLTEGAPYKWTYVLTYVIKTPCKIADLNVLQCNDITLVCYDSKVVRHRCFFCCSTLDHLMSRSPRKVQRWMQLLHVGTLHRRLEKHYIECWQAQVHTQYLLAGYQRRGQLSLTR